MARHFKRVILIILDGVGVGALPDADLYGDEGASTIPNIAKAVSGLNLPNLEKLGLGRIVDIEGVEKVPCPVALYGKMSELSPGKDTTTGHWEMMGLILKRAFETFPSGFPVKLIEEFERMSGYRVIGNKAASGTEIIKELGEEHLKTGFLIVYTSADSVFQIAAHEEVIPIDELYRICRIALDLVVPYNISRVIARPFRGEKGGFYRTTNREDFSLPPPDETVLDRLVDAGLTVLGIGKIKSIFAGRGITESIKTSNNAEGIEKTIEAIRSMNKEGMIFTNLVDFDMLWGHRNDVDGFVRGLEEFDAHLPEIMESMKDGDILFITADHGCDPTYRGTDHTREYVPLLVFAPEFLTSLIPERSLGIRSSFADIGATIIDIFGIEGKVTGSSFLEDILKLKNN